MTTPSLNPEDIDKVGLAVLTLSQELWTVMERQRLLENALNEKGLSVYEIIDDHAPSGALAEELEKERRRFIDRIVNCLSQETETTS